MIITLSLLAFVGTGSLILAGVAAQDSDHIIARRHLARGTVLIVAGVIIEIIERN